MSSTTFLQKIKIAKEAEEKAEKEEKEEKNKKKAERKKERNAKKEASAPAPVPVPIKRRMKYIPEDDDIPASVAPVPSPVPAPAPAPVPAPPASRIVTAAAPPASRIVTVATPSKNEAKNEAENAYKSLFMTWNKFKRLNEVEQKRIINLFPITDKDFEGLNIGNAVENKILTKRIQVLYENGLISFNTENRTRENLRFLADRGLIPPNNEFGTLYVNGVRRNVWNARRTQKKKAQNAQRKKEQNAQNAQITQKKKAQNVQNAARKQKENEELILKLKTPIGKFNKYINSNDINDNSNPFFKRIRRFFSTPNETEMTEIKRRNANENENEEKYP